MFAFTTLKHVESLTSLYTHFFFLSPRLSCHSDGTTVIDCSHWQEGALWKDINNFFGKWLNGVWLRVCNLYCTYVETWWRHTKRTANKKNFDVGQPRIVFWKRINGNEPKLNKNKRKEEIQNEKYRRKLGVHI